MNDSELHYVDFDTQKAWDEMMRTYIACGGDILYPGDEKEILLRAVLAIATAICAKVDSALRMDTLTYATGDYLTEYGLKRNCAPIDAASATATIQITFIPGGTARTIPAGTAMTADGTLIWETAEDIYQTGTAQTIETSILCRETGIIGNGLYAGAQMQPLENDGTIERIIVTAGASGGRDAEDEEAYRERIRSWGLSSVTTGPASLYESRTLAVSGEIIDARAINDGGGEVGIYLILRDGAEQAAIFSSVLEALSSESTRPLTDHVQVHAAEETPYTLNVKVWYSTYAALGDAVRDAIEAYQDWQDKRIGRAFNPNKLIAALYQAGCERVEFTSGSGMDGSLDYTQIDERAHCKGTITLTVVNT